MKGIVAQKLLKSIKPGVGRVPTVEIMTFTPTVKKLILEEEDHKLWRCDSDRRRRRYAGFHAEFEEVGLTTG